MKEGAKPDRTGPSMQVSEYEFTLLVTTCSITLKFPCKFSLSWKIDREVVEGYEKVQQSVSKLTFNEQLRLKTAIVSNDLGITYQPRKTILYLNFFTPSKPNEAKLAGVVAIDLAKCLEGREQQQYSLQRELDKNSWIRFAVDCKFIRQLDPQESESFSIMKLVQENISEHQSIRSGDSRDKRSAHNSLSKNIDKIVDKFFTPKTAKEDTPPSRPVEQPGFSPGQTSQSSELREQLRNTLPQRTEPSIESRQQPLQEQQYETPKPRSNDPGRGSVVSGLNRPPPSTPAIPKQQVFNLLTKFQSEKKLRESLQVQLEKTRDENQLLKQQTEQISYQLQQSEAKVRRLVESARKEQQSQTAILTRQNQQLKDDIKQMRYTYEQQKSISESLQRELIQLNYLYEAQKQTNSSLQKLVEECQIKHQQSTAVSPESLRSSNITDSRMIDSLQVAYKQKEKYCNDLQVELENVRMQLEEVEAQLEQQREQTSKYIQNMKVQRHDNKREQQLEQRIIELEEELENRNNVQLRESEDEFTNRVIEEFNMKEQEIRAIFGVLEKECMRLIKAMRDKQNKSIISTGIQVNLIDQPFSHAHSPIRVAHQYYQASTDDLKQSVFQNAMEEEQIARIRSQNESLRYQARELHNSLVDSRRTLWDFKQLVFKNNERSQRSIVKAEKSTRYRHHLRHIDRLKMQYTDKLRQMYEQIMHLNEVIYLNSAKQKEMVTEVEQIQEKYKFMQSASRQMRERLKQCREKHCDLIEGLRTTNARQSVEITKLKHTVSQQQEQLSSLRVQLDNMDNSDLLVVNNPNDIEQLEVELSKANNQNKELGRRYGEMMSYIEQIRAQQQKSEQMLILKDSEIEDLKDQIRRKKLTYPTSENKHILLIDEGEDEPTSSSAIREVLDVLKTNLKGIEQMKEVKSALKIIFDIYQTSQNANDVQNRSEKMTMMERIRQVSVEFQRLKINRIKSLQGSSELRKEFLKSIRPLQSKLDELLSFGRGVLNSKPANNRRSIHLLKKN